MNMVRNTAVLPKRPGPPKGYMPKYLPVKQLPLPRLDDPLLLERAVGLHEGEGGSYFIKGTLRITITMCSRDALERIQPVFGTKLTRNNPRKCERTEENPEGFNYRLSREGRFAKLIMETFIERGLSKEKTDQYNEVIRKCEQQAQVAKGASYDRLKLRGSLSGAQVKEAVSWGKVRPRAKKVTIIADATTALPLVACYAMTRRKQRP
jgi:hypothetical protein